jgi:hypothetical protein
MVDPDAIDGGRLGMHHRAAPLVNFDAGAQQLRIMCERPAWNTAQESVWLGKTSFTSTLRCAASVRDLSNCGSGDEIGVGEVHTLFRMIDRRQQREVDQAVRVIRGAADGAHDIVALFVEFGEIGFSASGEPFCLRQVSMNSFWYSATTGPSICRWVSRHPTGFAPFFGPATWMGRWNRIR